MDAIAECRRLRAELLALLALPALAACARPGPPVETIDPPRGEQATFVEAEPDLVAGETTLPAMPPPEGADFCMAASEAAKFAFAPLEGDCASAIDPVAAEDYIGPIDGGMRGDTDVRVTLVGKQGEGVTAACCYARSVYEVHIMRGRPMHVADGTALPDVEIALSGERGCWLEDARQEHASVASFARAALELMAHGAPPNLVDACLVAAGDELRHATLCLGMADAGPLGELRGDPAELGARPGSIAALARRTFEEGCVNETLAAFLGRRDAARARRRGDLEAARVHAAIAEDELRHAALAWAIVRWAKQRDPVGVAAALATSLAALGVVEHDDEVAACVARVVEPLAWMYV